jgi:hypothetical protein
LNKIIIILFLFYSTKIFSQYGIVEDKDGYTNIRKEKSAKSEVVKKVQNGQVLYIFQPENDKEEWLDCSGGYIHRSRVKFISTYKNIKPKLLKTELNFENKNLKISIKKEPFIAKNNKLNYRKANPKNNEATYLEKINGKKFYGCDGGIPKNQYGNSTVTFNDQTTKLSTENLFEPTLDYHKLFWDKINDIYYLTTSNSDGAGGYEVLWKIKDGKITQREIDYGF